MSPFSLFGSKPPVQSRSWGHNADGTPYVIGMTVAELREQLAEFSDSDEICMAVCPKKHWNGGGLIGKLKAIEGGIPGQIWLKGLVVDPSLE